LIIICVVTDTETPTIEKFDTGTKEDLGLETEESNGTWFLVVKRAQDYEIPNQRIYKFHVNMQNTDRQVDVTVVNLDDEPPYFDFLDSRTCEVSVSNSQFEFINMLYFEFPDDYDVIVV
jgi:hypothetical protein